MTRSLLIPRHGPSRNTIWLGALGFCVSFWLLVAVIIYALVS